MLVLGSAAGAERGLQPIAPITSTMLVSSGSSEVDGQNQVMLPQSFPSEAN